MPAAKPSKASIVNVIEAMKAAGIEPGEVRVDADGGFTVSPRESIDSSERKSRDGPRPFGVAR